MFLNEQEQQILDEVKQFLSEEVTPMRSEITAVELEGLRELTRARSIPVVGFYFFSTLRAEWKSLPEIENFADKVGEWTGNRITDADIDRGIEILDRNRKLMRDVYEVRKGENPRMTGLEAMYMVVTSQWADKREHSDEVERVLEKLETREMGKVLKETRGDVQEAIDTGFYAAGESRRLALRPMSGRG